MTKKPTGPPRRKSRRKAQPAAKPVFFDMDLHLTARGLPRETEEYRSGQVVYSQGDLGPDIKYIQEGAVKLTVLSRTGKEAVVAMLGAGDFFGEGVLAGQEVRIASATALSPSRVLTIRRDVMVKLLREDPSFSDQFISHMLSRNIRFEADLVDQLFNSSEKRLARALLLLARYGERSPMRSLPPISQETLAEMIGTTRSRVNFFMNKFRKLGLIEYNGVLKINDSLLGVVLHD